MTSRFFERRSFRNQLKTHLDAKGWNDLNWAESFSSFPIEEIVPPFIGITVVDYGKEELEMGSDPNINKMYMRRVQVNIYMESEDRTDALCDEVMDFMDMEMITIKDNNNNTLGSMISDTESLISDTFEPDPEEPANLQWSGVIAGMYEVHYPNG